MKLSLSVEQQRWASAMSKSTMKGRLARDVPVKAPVRTSSLNSVTAPGCDHTFTRDAELGYNSPGQLQTTQIQSTSTVSVSKNPRTSGSTLKDDNLVLGGQRGDALTSTSSVNGLRRHNSGPANSNGYGDSYNQPYHIPGEYLPGKDVIRRPLGSSPDNYRRSFILNKVPEEMESNQLSAVQSRVPVSRQRSYGSVGYRGAPPNVGGRRDNFDTLSYEEDSELSEQEEDWLLDEELATQGLYRGNYRILLALYTLVPISSLIAFVSLALIPILAFPSKVNSPFPYPPYLPYPLPEVFAATALWSLAYLLREPLYAACMFLTSPIPFPVYRFPSFIPFLASLLSAISQSAMSLFLRQLAVPILLVPYYSTERFHPDSAAHAMHKSHFPTWRDDAFRRVWWIALGWAMAEAVVGIKQGYENIGLYKDALVNVRKDTTKSGLMRETTSTINDRRERTPSTSRVPEDVDITPTQRNLDSQQSSTSRAPLMWQQERHRTNSRSPSDLDVRYHTADDQMHSGIAPETQPLLIDNSNHLSRQMTRESDRMIVENEVERDLEELIMIKNREELEEIYGIPVIRIPVFVSCLHRINSILSSLGTTLLLTAAYMRSTFAYAEPATTYTSVSRIPLSRFKPTNKYLLLAFPVLLALHSILTLMHTPWILPRLGVHTFVYIGLLVSLGLFFGGLGVWEVLM